jgi:hypothetical protein
MLKKQLDEMFELLNSKRTSGNSQQEICHYDILKNEFALIHGGVRYATMMMKTEKSVESIFYKEINQDIRYVLELATVFNTIVLNNPIVHIPEFYLFSTLRHFNQLHGFGEYNPFESTDDFYNHLSVIPKIEDIYLPTESNNIFYLPVVCDVKTSAKKWVAQSLKELSSATNVSALFLALITATRYQIDFLTEKEHDPITFPAFNTVNEAANFIEEIKIPADFEANAKRYFKQQKFNLCATLLIAGKVKNVLINSY